MPTHEGHPRYQSRAGSGPTGQDDPCRVPKAWTSRSPPQQQPGHPSDTSPSPQVRKEPEEPPAHVYLNIQELQEEAATGSSAPPAPEEPCGSRTDWETHMDTDSGHLFYYNPVTGETTWDCPFEQAEDGVSPAASPASSLAHSPQFAEWGQYVDEASGQAFFYNSVTGETSWDPPHTGDSSQDMYPGLTPCSPMEQRVSTLRGAWGRGRSGDTAGTQWGRARCQRHLHPAPFPSRPLRKRIILTCLRMSWRATPRRTTRPWAPMSRGLLTTCPRGTLRSWAHPRAGMGTATLREHPATPSTSAQRRYGDGMGRDGLGWDGGSRPGPPRPSSLLPSAGHSRAGGLAQGGPSELKLTGCFLSRL